MHKLIFPTPSKRLRFSNALNSTFSDSFSDTKQYKTTQNHGVKRRQVNRNQTTQLGGKQANTHYSDLVTGVKLNPLRLSAMFESSFPTFTISFRQENHLDHNFSQSNEPTMCCTLDGR